MKRIPRKLSLKKPAERSPCIPCITSLVSRRIKQRRNTPVAHSFMSLTTGFPRPCACPPLRSFYSGVVIADDFTIHNADCFASNQERMRAWLGTNSVSVLFVIFYMLHEERGRSVAALEFRLQQYTQLIVTTQQQNASLVGPAYLPNDNPESQVLY